MLFGWILLTLSTPCVGSLAKFKPPLSLSPSPSDHLLLLDADDPFGRESVPLYSELDEITEEGEPLLHTEFVFGRSRAHRRALLAHV